MPRSCDAPAVSSALRLRLLVVHTAAWRARAAVFPDAAVPGQTGGDLGAVPEATEQQPRDRRTRCGVRQRKCVTRGTAGWHCRKGALPRRMGPRRGWRAVARVAGPHGGAPVVPVRSAARAPAPDGRLVVSHATRAGPAPLRSHTLPAPLACSAASTRRGFCCVWQCVAGRRAGGP